MKFSQISRITKATVLSLAIVLGMSACSEDYTIDFLYVIGERANPGTISAYKVDNQSGSLTQIVDSPFSSGGGNPVGVVVAPNEKVLFVINQQTSSVVPFGIGTDGKIYAQSTYTLAAGATLPTAAAITPDGAYLVVAYTYQPGYPVAGTGPGAIVVFPVTYLYGSNGGITGATLGNPVSMGAASYFPVGVSPVSVGISPDPTPGVALTTDYLYVVEQTAAQGVVLTLALNPKTGVLTSVASTAAGVTPTQVAEDPTGRFVYITDQTANQLIGYLVQSNGSLSPMLNGPFSTSLKPEGIVADPRGKYLYVTNYNSSTITGYALDQATGTPSGVFSNGTTTSGTGPNCITIEPSQGIYLYTSNFVDNSVSGVQMDPHTGALVNVQNTPFGAAGSPTCVVAVAANQHAYQAVQP